MQVDIYAKNFKLTDAIRKNIESSIDTLDKYNLKITSISTIIWVKDSNIKDGYGIDLLIRLPHKSTIVIKHTDKDIYTAISMAIDRAKRVLGKYHSKIVDHKTDSRSKLELNDNSDNSSSDNIENRQKHYEIIDVEQQHTKPIYTEDAVAILEDSNNIFLVFTDTNGNRRVIYKRADNKFGIF